MPETEALLAGVRAGHGLGPRRDWNSASGPQRVGQVQRPSEDPSEPVTSWWRLESGGWPLPGTCSWRLAG